MKRPGGAERRCGGAAPLFDAPHAPPSIMYGALLPALRSVIKLLLLLKAQIHRDAPLRLVSLFFFLSFVSLLLFVPSVPHPLSFSLFSLSPHSFIHPLLFSALFYRHLVISYLLPQQSFCHPFSPASLFVFFPPVLPPVPLSFLSPSFPSSSLSLLSWLYECVLDLRALRRALLSPRRCSVFGMRR